MSDNEILSELCDNHSTTACGAVAAQICYLLRKGYAGKIKDMNFTEYRAIMNEQNNETIFEGKVTESLVEEQLKNRGYVGISNDEHSFVLYRGLEGDYIIHSWIGKWTCKYERINNISLLVDDASEMFV